MRLYNKNVAPFCLYYILAKYGDNILSEWHTIYVFFDARHAGKHMMHFLRDQLKIECERAGEFSFRINRNSLMDVCKKKGI